MPAATPAKVLAAGAGDVSPPYRPFVPYEPRVPLRAARNVVIGFATGMGLLVALIAYRVGCSLDASACAGFAAAAGHSYALDSGTYERIY